MLNKNELSCQGLYIKLEYNEEITNEKFVQLKMRQQLKKLTELKSSLEIFFENIKYNPMVININEAIMIFMRKLSKKKFNQVFLIYNHSWFF